MRAMVCGLGWLLLVAGNVLGMEMIVVSWHQAEKQRVLRMEFRTFLNAFIKIPCQIVRTGRQLVYRVLHYNEHLPVFFRLCTALRC